MGKEIAPDRVAIYIRWSTDDQASGTTLEVQREGCEHYLQSQGWRVTEDLIFVDDGFSGGTLDRPAMRRLRERVRAGDVDCVVVLKIDRLSRNIVDAVELVLREWADRCYLKSAREPIDTTADLGRMIFGILAMFADFERATIRERTQTGKVRRIAEGKQMHAEPAFGYMLDPANKGQWLEHPGESPLVRRIFRQACDGGSANAICRELNGEGVRTRAGKEWSIRGVLWVLHNRTYIGEVVYGRTSLRPMEGSSEATASVANATLAGVRGKKRLVRVTHETPKVDRPTDAVPALIDRETFDLAQTRLRANQWQRKSTGSRALASPHLLVGVAECPCGSALVHKVQQGERNRLKGKEYRHYICARSRQGTCSLNGHIPAAAAEQMVEYHFLNLFGMKNQREERFHPRMAATADDHASTVASLRAVELEVRELEEDDQRLLRDARKGKIRIDDLRALRESAERDRVQLTARLQALQQRLQELDGTTVTLRATLQALDAVDRWSSLSAPEQRQLLRMVLGRRVVLCKPKGKADISIELPWAF